MRKSLPYVWALLAALALHLLLAFTTPHASRRSSQPAPSVQTLVVHLLPAAPVPAAPVPAAVPPPVPSTAAPSTPERPAPERPAAAAPANKLKPEPAASTTPPAAPPPEGAPVHVEPAPVVRAPVPVSPIVPDYPRIARIRGYQGLVRVEAEIDGQGKVVNVNVIQSSGHSLLDDAAKSAVIGASFSPAERNGVPTRYRLVIPVRFSLSER